MSYCALITFENGKPANSFEYQNSYGGAAFIWTALFDRYLKDPRIPYDSWLSRNERELWDLAKNKKIPLWARAVHVSTFDRAIIQRGNFAKFKSDLIHFRREFPRGTGVCHLGDWTVKIGQQIKRESVEAIGFYQTSVTENPWYSWDEESEESVPYNLKKQDSHLEVYDWLKGVDA